MKKSKFCFFIMITMTAAVLLVLVRFGFYRPKAAEPVPGQTYETETLPEDNPVFNQSIVEQKLSAEIYCLAAENGFLYVFYKDPGSICLDTHMPLSDFPVTEQERLMHGIWFSSMMEVFSYLESYTS